MRLGVDVILRVCILRAMAFDDHFNPGVPHWGSMDMLERPWALLAHGSLLTAPFLPFVGPIVGPLAVIYTVGHRNKVVHAEATRALNFGITLSLVWLGVRYYGFFTGEIQSQNDVSMLEFYVYLVAMPFIVLSMFRAFHGDPSRYALAVPWIRAPKVKPETTLAKYRMTGQSPHCTVHQPRKAKSRWPMRAVTGRRYLF